MPDNLPQITLRELAPAIREKRVSPVEVVEQTLARIDKENGILNAFLTVAAAEALQQARQAEKEIMAGRYRGILHGVPVSLKDVIATRDIRTTGGSKLLGDWVPDFDAAVVVRLRRAGAVLLGKTNCDEFAAGVYNKNPHFRAAKNPGFDILLR